MFVGSGDILNLNDILNLLIAVGHGVLIFFGDIWLFVKLISLLKISKLFLKSSKRENFEGGKILLKKTRSLFAVGILLDVLTAYFSMSLVYGLKTVGIILLIFQIAACAAHFGFAVPVLICGNKAEKLFRNLYPSALRATVHEKPDYSKQFAEKENDGLNDSKDSEPLKSSLAIAQSDAGNFFDIAETERQEPPAAAKKYAEKAGEESEKGEIIQYDDEGYIGTWHAEKPEENKEAVPQKECPFCGTLNGIDNSVCDFCGAEL